MCSPYLYVDPIEGFRGSVNKDYRELSTRTLVYGDNILNRQRLLTERKCGIFACLPMKNYVVLYDGESDDLLWTLRIMNDCVSTYFSGFAFQKYSPYTKLFNWHIRRSFSLLIIFSSLDLF